MSRDDPPKGFFRGAEFSRLLILAVLLLVGWPAVYYYGFARVRNPAPRPAPIASLPPLPQPDPNPVLAGLVDIKKVTREDDPSKAYLLEKTREAGDALSRQARREVLPVNLLKNPKRYRGVPIHFEGFAKQVFAVDDIPPELSPSGRLYEIWMTTLDHDQRGYPVSLIVEQVPPSLAGGRDVAERVAFDGFFLRLISYQATDGVRFAPMLIGRVTHFPEQSERPAKASSWFYTLLPVGLLVAYVVLRMIFNVRRVRRRLPARSPTADTSPPVDAKALQQWLESPPTHEEKEDGSPG